MYISNRAIYRVYLLTARTAVCYRAIKTKTHVGHYYRGPCAHSVEYTFATKMRTPGSL